MPDVPAPARAAVGPEQRLRLAFAAGVLDVLSADAATLVWLAEFLGPAFQLHAATGPEEGTPTIVFAVDPERRQRLRRRLPADAPPVDVFTQDGSFERHPGMHGDDGWHWVHDERSDAFVGVAADAAGAGVVVDRTGPFQRLALMRLVRELATAVLLRAGHLPVHGAVCAYERGAVLICGPKRAGKTSLLVHALARGAAFIANDRAFVDLAGGAEVTGMPTIVMLRSGTLSFFPELARRFAAARFDRGRTLAECAPGVVRPEPETRAGFDRPGISPAQLCHLLDAPMHAHAPLERLLFPVIAPATEGLELVPVAPARARALLARSLLKPSHPKRISALFAAEHERDLDPGREAERCRTLCERVPAFECRLGPQAFAGDLLDALRRAPP